MFALSVLLKWLILYIYSAAKYFAIRNQSSELVLDVHGASAKAGAAVILYKHKDDRSNNQLWYEDQQGYIRSKLNDYLLTKESGSGKSAALLHTTIIQLGLQGLWI